MKETSRWLELKTISYFYLFRMRIAIWWSSCFYHVFYMIIEFFRSNCTLLESGVPIKILMYLLRQYMRSCQDWLILSKGLARLPGLAKGSCQMFDGIISSVVRIWCVGICASWYWGILLSQFPESILGSCHTLTGPHFLSNLYYKFQITCKL